MWNQIAFYYQLPLLREKQHPTGSWARLGIRQPWLQVLLRQLSGFGQKA
jgi:hypothetical protein